MGGRERAASFGVREFVFCPIEFHLCVPDDVRAVVIGRAVAWVFGIIVGVYKIRSLLLRQFQSVFGTFELGAQLIKAVYS
jgi:hypothetical protein